MTVATTAEDQYSAEDKNRADSFAKELLARLGRDSLAEVSENDLTDFRYQANLHVTDRAYQLLRTRMLAAKQPVSPGPEFFDIILPASFGK